jgi:hypothetical protein
VYSSGFFYSLPVKASPISACRRIVHSWNTNTHRYILIFTSSALKTWVLHVNNFIYGCYCIYHQWQPLTYLYFPYCISLIYFSFTKIRMFLYARIYWLAEFGDVYINMSLCTRDNRCQGPITCCRQLPVYDIGCVCSFTCLPNVRRTNPGK